MKETLPFFFWRFVRGKGESVVQRALEEKLARMLSVSGETNKCIEIAPEYTVVAINHLQTHDAAVLLEQRTEINRHLENQKCGWSENSDEVVRADLIYFLEVEDPTEVSITPEQIAHLFEHLLINYLAPIREVSHLDFEARTFGQVIFFNNTFTPVVGRIVIGVVWNALMKTLQGERYPTPEEIIKELETHILYATDYFTAQESIEKIRKFHYSHSEP